MIIIRFEMLDIIIIMIDIITFFVIVLIFFIYDLELTFGPSGDAADA